MTNYKLHHTDDKYETSNFNPSDFVPEGFEHNETLDFRKKTNYIFEDNNRNVFRVTVKKDAILYGVMFYANNKEKGHSCSFPATDESELADVRNRVLSRVDLN